MSKSKVNVEKQDILQAVVVTNFFHKKFWPACDKDSCLVPLVNKPLLYYTLDFLESSGIKDIILFCSSETDNIKGLVKNSRFHLLDITYTTSDTCRSLGDVLRHIDACALIRNDFILLEGNVVGKLSLLPLVKNFKNLRDKDKGAVMTLIYQQVNVNNDQTLVLSSKTNRILFHNKKKTKLYLPVELVLNESVDIRQDLLETNIAICSTAVPPLFADNFDFQTLDDFIKGLLINEEILNSTLYAYINNEGYVNKVYDWPSYQNVSQDILSRWSYPQVPDVIDKYNLRYGNVYYGENLKLALTCKINKNSVIGSNSKLGSETSIYKSIIGKNCTIGNNVTIENSYLFNGTKVKDNCIIKFSVIGYNSIIGENNSITDGCILGSNVVIEPRKMIQQKRLIGYNIGNNLEMLSAKAFIYNDHDDSEEEEEEEVTGLVYRTHTLSINYSSSENEDSVSIAGSLPDDTSMFYSEVVDSLIRGFEDHVHCDNLILEINSSRYAYNINYREANFQVIRAILTLNSAVELEALNQVRYYAQLQSKLNYFLPLLKNYIKNVDSCEDCLLAIEDTAKGEEMLNSVVVKVIHHLYETNILSEESILKWHEKDGNGVFGKTIREKTSKLVKWLKEAEEETDSDNDSE
ncbi:translation initiation factor eIF-2B subunit epsilon [Daktulosphaira vitifoliae]|uniref:translation initiation factor eIF-2B subunit epsilon n=1 Tax=Daktulosphaira vitifoliae TaxID=58002 RepID=UPI0021AA7E03|nr:translation initiation factor eIF-2B subunit epsilon [Daktulosphaira vitifoliae]